jgi:hypothetical protein
LVFYILFIVRFCWLNLPMDGWSPLWLYHKIHLEIIGLCTSNNKHYDCKVESVLSCFFVGQSKSTTCRCWFTQGPLSEEDVKHPLPTLWCDLCDTFGFALLWCCYLLEHENGCLASTLLTSKFEPGNPLRRRAR